MLTVISLLIAALSTQASAQSSSPASPAPASVVPVSAIAPTLDTGPCLDSARAVPRALQAPALAATQVVRIDKIVSTATLTEGEVIGFLYTAQDGSSWLGQRTSEYMSAANARAVNQVLASTHMPGENVSAFPPQSRYGVPTKLPQFFRVQIPGASFDALHIRLDPCVAWPSGRTLPDPQL